MEIWKYLCSIILLFIRTKTNAEDEVSPAWTTIEVYNRWQSLINPVIDRGLLPRQFRVTIKRLNVTNSPNPVSSRSRFSFLLSLGSSTKRMMKRLFCFRWGLPILTRMSWIRRNDSWKARFLKESPKRSKKRRAFERLESRCEEVRPTGWMDTQLIDRSIDRSIEPRREPDVQSTQNRRTWVLRVRTAITRCGRQAAAISNRWSH